MNQEEPPVPDLLSSRKTDDTVGAPVGEPLSFEDAIGQNPDIGELWMTARASFEAAAKANNEMARAAQQGLQAPPQAAHRLHAINMAYCRELDKVMNCLNEETDQTRIELIQAIYQNLCHGWQSMVLQTHMTRAGLRSPKSMHEMLMTEATILLERAQKG